MDRLANKQIRTGLPVLLAVLGAAYCAAVEFGLGEVLCLTNGCSLYQNFSFQGISLWHVGFVTFLALAGLSIAGKAQLALILSGLTILADCFLLLLMTLTSPCVACMGAAAFLALVFYSLHRAVTAHNAKNERHHSKLLVTWLFFFVAAVLVTIKELSAPSAWYGPQDAPARLYFSPNCPACMQAIDAFAASATPVAYYPVAVDLAEVKIILAVEEDLKHNIPLAASLRKHRANPPASLPLSFNTLGTMWQILRNRADVLAMGKGSVPLILINGVPQNNLPAPAQGLNSTPPVTPENPAAPAPKSDALSIQGILNLNTAQCEETPNAPPCPEPATPEQ